METTPQLLRFLADDGHPLDLRVVQDGASRDIRHYRINKDDGSHVAAQSRSGLPGTILELEAMLAHHPRGITLNGVPLKRSPYNGLCRITETRYHGTTSRDFTVRDISVGTDSVLRGRSDAFCAGVAFQFPDNPGIPGHQYHAIADATRPHWHRLSRITLHPATVIPKAALEHITPTSLRLMAAAVAQTTDPELTADTARRTANTLHHPDAPPRWSGPVYEYLNVPADTPAALYFQHGAPIAAAGIPVSFNTLAAAKETPIHVSAIHALYNHDAGLVPVGPELTSHEAAVPTQQIQHLTFEWEYQGIQTGVPGITRMPRIVMGVKLSGETVYRPVPAPVLMTGDLHDQQVAFVRERTTPESLAHAMFLAYMQVQDHMTPENVDQAASRLAWELQQKAQAAHGDPQEAYRTLLEEHLNRFNTSVAYPAEPITAKSRDGRITATTAPASAATK